jgi:uncharacterized membrane protein
MAGGNYDRGVISSPTGFFNTRNNIESTNSTAFLIDQNNQLLNRIDLLEKENFKLVLNQNTEINELKNNLKTLQSNVAKAVSKSDEKISVQEGKISAQSNKNIEILALFATFFTFISVNVQVFSNLKNLYQSLIFVFFFGLILIAFLMLFFAYTRKFWEEGEIWRWASVGVFLLLLVGSACLVFKNRDLLTKQTFLPECENLSVEAGPRDCLITKEQMSDYLKNSKKDSNKN